MTTTTGATPWSGRHDGDGAEHARWHNVVAEIGPDRTASGDHVSLVGFRTDEGVRRNGGRIGAADGPEALRTGLAPLAAHGVLATGHVSIVDHGDAITEGTDLETGQDDAAQKISAALSADGTRLTVVLGGGHETAWASYRGLVESTVMTGHGRRQAPRWGVLNLDAHFDLRSENQPTSGTPFLQMAEAEEQAGRELNYAVVGIAQPSNTGVLFDEARRRGVRWMTDTESAEAGPQGITRFIEDFAADLDILYLTIDLDVLPADVAPGVSAPAALGVATSNIVAAVRAAANTGKLTLVDVVELNPSLDLDRRTAKTAARLIDEAARTVLNIEA